MVVVDIEDYQTVMGAYVQVSNRTKGVWDLEGGRSWVEDQFEIGMVQRLLSLLDSWASEEVVDILRRHVEVTDQLQFEEPPWNWGYTMLREWKVTTADEGLVVFCVA